LIIRGKKNIPYEFLSAKVGRENYKPMKKVLTGQEREDFIKWHNNFRLNGLLNNFVNYNKASSPLEEWLNRVGLVLFTKYPKRIQRVIATTGIRYPIKSLMTILFDQYIMELPTINETNFLTNEFYNFNPVNTYSSMIETLVTPAWVRL
jgi:hypothetical protein